MSVATSNFATYTHQDMVIHSHAFYTLQRGKRMYSHQEPDEKERRADAWFEFEADLFPPLMLMPTTWRRYGYTIEDVHNTYDKLDASYVWQLALMLLCGIYEPESASAGVRPTFQSMFTFLFISRKAVFDVFIESQSAAISKCVGSSLCHERTDHKPLLPKVNVDKYLFDTCKSMVPSIVPSFRRNTCYDHVIHFKDITLVPVEWDEDHNLVYMVRVVPKTIYDALPVQPKLCIVTMPVTITTRQASEHYIMVDEACFFTSEENNTNPATSIVSQKRKQPKSNSTIKKRKT